MGKVRNVVERFRSNSEKKIERPINRKADRYKDRNYYKVPLSEMKTLNSIVILIMINNICCSLAELSQEILKINNFPKSYCSSYAFLLFSNFNAFSWKK